jgi:hypothetical protein
MSPLSAGSASRTDVFVRRTTGPPVPSLEAGHCLKLRMQRTRGFLGLGTALAALASIVAPLPVGAQSAAILQRSPTLSGGLFGVDLLEGPAEVQISPDVAATYTVEAPTDEPEVGAHGPPADPGVASGDSTNRTTFLIQKLPADVTPYSSLLTRPAAGRTTTRKPSFHEGTGTPSSA